MQFNKVLVVGLGQLGLPVAKYVKQRGFDTYGYDLNPKAVEIAEKTAAIKKAVNFSDFDVFILCVSTHKADDMFSPQIDGLLSIADKISKEANKEHVLVSIESTIPKGTSRKVFELLNYRFHVVNAPHRWYALQEKEHGVNQLRVIGGVADCCLRVGMQFYNGYDNNSNNIKNNATVEEQDSSSFTHSSLLSQSHLPRSLRIPMNPVSKKEIAGVTKIIENAHRYLQIAFAEDLYLYCQANNLNFSELRDALNTKWNVNILVPSEVIGGHCLPKDAKMFMQSSSNGRKSKILTAAIETNEDYNYYELSEISDNDMTRAF
jgi:UDP-N-acetyl-D-mannosaminuronic acid dehydrogenase